MNDILSQRLESFSDELTELLRKHNFEYVVLMTHGKLHKGYVLGMQESQPNNIIIGSRDTCPCCANEATQ